ncbi:MAG: ATP-binding protein [Pseudomonadota bacterium]|nr:ATP-binding protein [Pseudomonadota bacterium]
MQLNNAPLHFKISSLTALFLLLFSLSTLTVSHGIIKKTLVSELQEDTKQLLNALEEKAEFILLFESATHASELNEILRQFSYIQSSTIRNNDNTAISSYTNPQLEPSDSDLIITAPIYRSENATIFPSEDSDSYRQLGTMTLRVSIYRLQTTQQTMIKGIGLLCLFFLTIIVISYFVMSKRLLKPLRDMVSIMNKFVVDSKFNEKANTGTTQEFTEIAVAYNKMMAHLEKMTINLDRTNQELKNEIEEKEASYKQQQKLEEQLSQAQKLEAIGRMTAAIAHDFNNILGGILGFSRLSMDEIKTLKATPNLEENPSVLELEDSINEIHLGGERAQAIIRQLLVFSRKAEAKPVALDTHKTIKQLYPFLKTSLPSSIQLDIHSTADNAILIDPTHFEQIIVNLVINARDALSNNGNITITTEEFLPPKLTCSSCKSEINSGISETFVKISIIDNGPGISPENLAQIFDPFFTTKDKDKGTGMGLSIIHGLVHKHNGHIFVDSTPDKGTSFSLFFPKQALVAETDAQKSTKVTQHEPGTIVSKLPVMIVDDNEQLLKFMRLFLKNNGYEVETYTSPSKALTSFISNNGQYLAVVSDYIMPKISGADLCKAMLRFKASTNVIICSGYNEELHDENKKINDVIYMVKPINHDELLGHLIEFASKT